MKKLFAAIILAILLLAPVSVLAEEKSEKSIGHRLLFYIPNRIFDVFDIVRGRVRVGPGIGVDARVTKYGDVFVGSYSALFVGVPGPRTEPQIPWPIGFESRAGIKATDVANVSSEGPKYGYGEVGLGFQLAIVGVDVGVDPAEALDFILGFFFIDLTGDDY